MIITPADLRPGDIGVMKMGGFVPGFIPVRIGQMACKESYQVGPYSADHVLVCVEAGVPAQLLTGERLSTIARGNLGLSGQEILELDRPARAARAVQAMPRGAEEISLSQVKHWGPGVRWFRLPEDYPGQAQDAAAIARLFVSEKVPYSWLSYLALAAWSRGLKAERLERWIDRRSAVNLALLDPSRAILWGNGESLPQEAICSVLADQCWSLAGKTVIHGVRRQCVTPGRLAIALEETPGVIRSARVS